MESCMMHKTRNNRTEKGCALWQHKTSREFILLHDLSLSDLIDRKLHLASEPRCLILGAAAVCDPSW